MVGRRGHPTPRRAGAGGPSAERGGPIMTDKATLLTPEKLLGAGAGRRATALLGAIENRTAQLAAQSRQPNPYLPAASLTERNAAFLGAIAAGRDAASVTIQEIERHTPAWAALLPERRDPSLYATLAQ